MCRLKKKPSRIYLLTTDKSSKMTVQKVADASKSTVKIISKPKPSKPEKKVKKVEKVESEIKKKIRERKKDRKKGISF